MTKIKEANPPIWRYYCQGGNHPEIEVGGFNANNAATQYVKQLRNMDRIGYLEAVLVNVEGGQEIKKRVNAGVILVPQAVAFPYTLEQAVQHCEERIKELVQAGLGQRLLPERVTQ